MQSCPPCFEGVAVRPARPARPPRATPRAQLPCEVVGEFFQELFSHAGLPADAYRARALHRRIPACLRYLGVRDLPQAIQRLRQHPDLVGPLLNTVLLGVTEFFRDMPVFEALRDVLVDRAYSRPLRIWSAACSDGQELYSMAMMLQRISALEGAELLGTDFREDAIVHARRGAYSKELGRSITPTSRGKFVLDAWSFQAPEELLRSVSWKRADLLARVESGPWDVILWRNMAIYLNPAAAERVWFSLCEELRPGGIIVAGKAEQPPAWLPMRKLSPCLFEKLN